MIFLGGFSFKPTSKKPQQKDQPSFSMKKSPVFKHDGGDIQRFKWRAISTNPGRWLGPWLIAWCISRQKSWLRMRCSFQLETVFVWKITPASHHFFWSCAWFFFVEKTSLLGNIGNTTATGFQDHPTRLGGQRLVGFGCPRRGLCWTQALRLPNENCIRCLYSCSFL